MRTSGVCDFVRVKIKVIFLFLRNNNVFQSIVTLIFMIDENYLISFFGHLPTCLHNFMLIG